MMPILNRPVLSRRSILRIGAGSAAASVAGRAALALTDIARVTVTGSTETTAGAAFKRSGKVRIGFSNGFSGNTWRTECIASLRNEVAKHPEIADLIVVDGQGDITKQVNDIQDLIAQQVDAILCIPNSSTAVAPALARAMRAKIPVVPFNLGVSGTQWCSYIGTDPFKKGVAWGKFLTDTLGNKGKIVALGGIPGNSGTAACWAGTQTTLGKGIEVLAMKDAYWQEDRAKVVMADLIVAYPQIDAVWCDGGQDGAGVAKAMIAAGRKLVPITGDDYNGLLKVYDQHHADNPDFKLGLISEPTWESTLAVRTALALLSGKDVPKQQIIQPTLIDDANYTQYVKRDLPDGVFVDTDLTDAELAAIFH
jgi:ribose transport system substrate-binding protein